MNKSGNDERRGISIACCHSHLCYTSYVSIHDKRQAHHGLLYLLMRNRVFLCRYATGSSLPAGVQKGLISLLVLSWIFFPCWCFKNFLFTMATKKMATGHETHKLGRQLSNDHKCQIWFTSLHWLWRKCNLSIFPIISIWELSVAMVTKLRGRST